jgi:hypothetical protein
MVATLRNRSQLARNRQARDEMSVHHVDVNPARRRADGRDLAPAKVSRRIDGAMRTVTG